MLSRVLFYTAALAALIAISAVSFAAPVTMDRMLREHTVYVVTNLPPETLDQYWLDWRPEKVVAITLSELLNRKNRLEDGGFVFFMLDRSRMRRPIAEEEELLPCTTSSISPAQVLVYASKTANKRSPARQNRWDVMITAPNAKWLTAELQRLTEAGLLTKPLDERGIMLDRYDVKRMTIVSTEGRQIAEEWVRRQSVPGRDAIDWEFVPLKSWDPASDSGNDTLFLFCKDTLRSTGDGLPTVLPSEIRSWLEGPDSLAEVGAQKRVASSGQDESRAIAVVAAPCARQLELALERHSSLNWVPESLERHKLSDMSEMARVVVVARPGNRSSDDTAALLDDLAAKVTSALGSPDVGLACESRQDLKELIYESLRKGKDTIVPSDADRISAGVGAGCGLAVVDLAAVDLHTDYAAEQPRCLTDPYPEFSVPRPSEPSKPDPHARKYGLFGPRVYPKGSDDPKYWRDLRDWEDDMDEYEQDLRHWQRDKEEYESRRYYHDMEWERSVRETQTARITGNLKIYDLSSFGSDGATTGRVIFSCPISGSCERRQEHSSDRIVVRGEDTRPTAPDVPSSENAIQDQTVLSEAFQDACAQAARQVLEASILPKDRAAASVARNIGEMHEEAQ